MYARLEITVAAAVVVMGAVACGPSIRSGPGRRPALESSEASATGSPGDRIAAGELRRVQGHTAADAVRQLRPAFLRSGGRPTPTTTPSVYVNERYSGGLEVLDLLPLSVVTEIRYVDAVAAKSLFGSYCRCEGGVILVRTGPQ